MRLMRFITMVIVVIVVIGCFMEVRRWNAIVGLVSANSCTNQSPIADEAKTHGARLAIYKTIDQPI